LNPDFDPAVHQVGLKLVWHGHRVFCNPPWDTIMPWVEKDMDRALSKSVSASPNFPQFI
jgi:hypothetical protein